MTKKSFPLRARPAIARAVRRMAPTVAGRRQLAAETQIVLNSDLFDPGWYLRTYPDVDRAGIDPLRHFLEIGWREGRDPGPDFTTAGYLKANADVARAGTNPLVHFLEFGRFEGRGAFVRRETMQAPVPSFAFPAAAPCISVAPTDEPPISWRRSHELDGRRPDCLKVADRPIGYSKNVSTRESVCEGFALLAWLSGGLPGRSSPAAAAPTAGPLIDAWYVSPVQLKVRWSAHAGPVVIRAYQHDPLLDVVCLVGEALVRSSLDLVDVHPRNAWFPLLFVIAEPDGTLVGSARLPFPSLCRGGLHYPELLLAEGAAKADPMSGGMRLAERLLDLKRGDAEPLVGSIRVDLDGAGALEPWFHEQFLAWLAHVAGIAPTFEGGNEAIVEPRLAGSFAEAPNWRSSTSGSALHVGSRLIPTIAALTQAAVRKGSEPARLRLPFLAASKNAERVLLIDLPRESVRDWAPVHDHPAALPRLETDRGPEGQLPVAAIRLPAEMALSEADLFAPLVGRDFAGRIRPRPPVTWLIDAGEWVPARLASAIVALSLQGGADEDRIALVGAVGRRTIAIAKQLFPTRTQKFASLGRAVENIQTPLAGWVGPHVILHDNRSAGLLAALLENDGAATASCVLVETNQASRSADPAIATAGTFAVRGSSMTGAEYDFLVGEMWRSTFRVVSPPPGLWIARSSRVRSWTGKGDSSELGGDYHLVSTLVSASYDRARAPSEAGLSIPATSPERATRVEIFVG